jgi:hypothetical protein
MVGDQKAGLIRLPRPPESANPSQSSNSHLGSRGGTWRSLRIQTTLPKP